MEDLDSLKAQASSLLEAIARIEKTRAEVPKERVLPSQGGYVNPAFKKWFNAYWVGLKAAPTALDLAWDAWNAGKQTKRVSSVVRSNGQKRYWNSITPEEREARIKAMLNGVRESAKVTVSGGVSKPEKTKSLKRSLSIKRMWAQLPPEEKERRVKIMRDNLAKKYPAKAGIKSEGVFYGR